MSVEQFTMPPDFTINLVVIVLLALGIAFTVASFSSRIVKAIPAFSLTGRRLGNKYAYLAGGILLIVLSLLICVSVLTPSTVTVGSGYINVEFAGFSPDLPGVPFASGSKNVTSTEIADAFVGRIGVGDFTLDKQVGTNTAATNIGVFRLGNGAIAYVASVNSTDLIIKLNSGEYLIVGTQNTQTLAQSFSENVYPIKSP
jgi:hypothetical protein